MVLCSDHPNCILIIFFFFFLCFRLQVKLPRNQRCKMVISLKPLWTWSPWHRLTARWRDWWASPPLPPVLPWTPQQMIPALQPHPNTGSLPARSSPLLTNSTRLLRSLWVSIGPSTRMNWRRRSGSWRTWRQVWNRDTPLPHRPLWTSRGKRSTITTSSPALVPQIWATPHLSSWRSRWMSENAAPQRCASPCGANQTAGGTAAGGTAAVAAVVDPSRTLKCGFGFQKGEVGPEKTGKVVRSTEIGPTIITITTTTPPLPPPPLYLHRLPHPQHKNTQVLPAPQEVAKRSLVTRCERALRHLEKGPTCQILPPAPTPRKSANRPETRFSCRHFPECPPTRWGTGLTSWASRTIRETIHTPRRTKPTRMATIRAASPTSIRTHLTCWTRCSARKGCSRRNLRYLTIALSTESTGIAVALAEEPSRHLYPQNHLHLCHPCPNKPVHPPPHHSSVHIHWSDQSSLGVLGSFCASNFLWCWVWQQSNVRQKMYLYRFVRLCASECVHNTHLWQ